MPRIVVVGGGQAGYSAIAKLRALGFEGEISLICGESELPYQRPPLSKAYLLGKFERKRLYLRQSSFYSENDVDVHLGEWCRRLDVSSRRVETDKNTYPYDSLILSTGSVPRNLPKETGGGLKGVYTVRSIADIDAIAAELRPNRKAVIIGGGYIGLEMASALVTNKLKVTVVEAAGRILQRVAARETSDHLRKLHIAHGVAVLESAALETLVDDSRGRVCAVKLTDGRKIEAEIVIVGIGILPATDLAADAGLTLENGVSLDAFGRTSDSSVWAAGDCASFPWRGSRIRLESVQNAIDQAETVAANILGSETKYVPTPWFWSDQYDAKLQIAGLGAGYHRIVRRPGSGEGAVSHWYFRGSQLLAVDAVNDPRSYMVGKRLLEMKKSPDPEMIADPDTSLKSLLR